MASDSKEATIAQKIDALRIETKLKQQAIRDTSVRNHYLHKQVSDLHAQLEQIDKEAKVEEDLIERNKRKLTIDRADHKSVAELLDEHSRMVEDGIGEELEHRLATVAVLERNGIPAGKPVPLTTLESLAHELEKELAAAREENEVVDVAHSRLLERKSVIESDIKRQLGRNERINKELAKCKTIIKKNASLARDENAQVIQLERKLREVQSSCENLRAEQRSQEKYNTRLQDKLRGYSSEMKSMQSQKNAARSKAVDEAAVSEEREKWIAQLRDENKRMVDFLLLDQDDATAGGKVVPDDEDTDFEAVESLLETSRKIREKHQLKPVAGARSKSVPVAARRHDQHHVGHQLAERKLLNELGDAIEGTAAAVAATKERTTRLLKGRYN